MANIVLTVRECSYVKKQKIILILVHSMRTHDPPDSTQHNVIANFRGAHSIGQQYGEHQATPIEL
ncbi:hypothetical protein DsansV1_C13g0118311 [Dioscorea sansibarensis]